MKKIIIILAVLLVVILGALAVLPSFFKKDLEAVVSKELNSALNAQVNLGDINLSLFRNFPALSLSVDRLQIINHPPFSDTLATFRRLEVSLGIAALFSGKQDVQSVLLDAPRVNLRVLPDGQRNWDIVNAAEEAADGAADDSSGISMAIRQYALRNGSLVYHNEVSGASTRVSGLNHSGSGDFSAETFILNTVTSIAGIDYSRGAISYLSGASFDSKADIQVDLQQKRYEFKENSFRLNQLTVRIDGWLSELRDGMDMSLRFEAPQADVRQVLSLAALFSGENYQDLQGSGTAKLAGFAKGSYTETQLPQFNAELVINQGEFKFASLPTPVKGLQMELAVSNPGGDKDATLINLRQLSFSLLDKPISSRLVMTRPFSDMVADGAVKGSLDLAELKRAIPLGEDLKLQGRLDSDLKFNGSLLALEENQPERFSSTGDLRISDFRYQSPDLPDQLNVQQAQLSFTSTRAELRSFKATLGQTDLSASGELQNLFGYLMANQTLYGSLKLHSETFDANPWITGESETIAPVELPDRIEFLVEADARQVLVDQLDLRNASGSLVLKDRRLSLQNLRANALNGTIVANGSYAFIPPAEPKMDFALNLENLSIPQLYSNIVTVQKMIPIANYVGGDISGSLTLDAPLDGEFMPVWQQLLSQGKMTIPKANVKNFAPFNKLSETLQISALRDPAFSNIRPSYHIKNGRFYLDPLTLRVGNYDIVVAGSNGLDQSLDYSMQVTLPAAELKQSANAEMSKLLKTDLALLGNAPVNVNFQIGGTPQSPTLKTTGVTVVENLVDPIKARAGQEVEKQKAKAENAVQQEVEKKKQEAKDAVGNRLKSLFGGKKK